jgi:hypothetical protein
MTAGIAVKYILPSSLPFKTADKAGKATYPFSLAVKSRSKNAGNAGFKMSFLILSRMSPFLKTHRTKKVPVF